MGKRELLIIVAFVVVGAVAYQITAPPAKDGEGFSFSRLWRETRRNMRGNAPIATHNSSGTFELDAAVRQLRVSGFNRGVRIIGERRDDIGYELSVGSSGPDEATALALARDTHILQDAVNESLGLYVKAPGEGSQYSSVLLRVPQRLAVRVDGPVGSASGGTAGARIETVAALELEATGSVTVDGVAGAITGSHGSGELHVSNAGSVDLRLDGSRARFAQVAEGLTITGRQARCEIASSGGAIDVSGNGVTSTIRDPSGPVRVSGSSGRVTIDGPRAETRIDVRRTEVQVTLHAPAPITILTTDSPARLLLAGNVPIAIDAVTTGSGRITATEFGLSPETTNGEQRLTHTIGSASSARVTIRNQRGHIVIGRVK
jgi:hypothetical protein